MNLEGGLLLRRGEEGKEGKGGEEK